MLSYDGEALIYRYHKHRHLLQSPKGPSRITGIPKIPTEIPIYERFKPIKSGGGRVHAPVARPANDEIRCGSNGGSHGQGNELAVASRQDEQRQEHGETATANNVLDVLA